MKAINLIGQRFTRLTVVSEIPKHERTGARSNRPQWLCKCDCGMYVKVPGWNLTCNNTKSCGCLKSENSRKICTILGSKARKYILDIAVARCIYNYYKEGDLKFEDFYKLSQMNCYYCNTIPSNHSKNAYYKNNTYYYNGLDRINNNLPHNKDNVVPCCKICNRAKNNLTIEKFYSMIENIIKHRQDIIPDWITLYNENYNIFDFNKVKSKLLHRYKDINFDIKLFYFLMSQNCFYCHRQPSNYKKSKNGEKISCGGLDRIDSTIGHTLKNVVPCCKYCNIAKGNMTLNQFYTWAQYVYNRNKLQFNQTLYV